MTTIVDHQVGIVVGLAGIDDQLTTTRRDVLKPNVIVRLAVELTILVRNTVRVGAGGIEVRQTGEERNRIFAAIIH